MYNRLLPALRCLVWCAIGVVALTIGASASQPQLIDQTGRTFTLSSLRGMPVVVTFVAAHCTDACPLVNAQFSKAAHSFAQERLPIRLLTITLDPEHDPPSVMRSLAYRFGANPHVWRVTSGSVRDVHAVMQQFDVVAQRGRNGYADVHSTFVFLIDRSGRVRKAMLASLDLGSQLVDEVHAQWKVLSQ